MLHPLIKSENFYVGFETAKRGRIYLNGNFFANFFTMPPDWGKHANKIAFNRDALAIQMECPEIMPHDKVEEFLPLLERFLIEFKKKHLK